MPSHFATIGPIELINTSQPLEAPELKAFWARIPEEFAGLADAIGVYVLAVDSDTGMKPVYIGKAEHGFRARLKPNHDAFRRIRSSHPNQRLSVFFLARVTTKTMKFVRKRDKGEELRSIKDLEILLIRDCLHKNFSILNSSGVKFYREMVVPGFLHDKDVNPTPGATSFRRLLKARPKT